MLITSSQFLSKFINALAEENLTRVFGILLREKIGIEIEEEIEYEWT